MSVDSSNPLARTSALIAAAKAKQRAAAAAASGQQAGVGERIVPTPNIGGQKVRRKLSTPATHAIAHGEREEKSLASSDVHTVTTAATMTPTTTGVASAVKRKIIPRPTPTSTHPIDKSTQQLTTSKPSSHTKSHATSVASSSSSVASTAASDWPTLRSIDLIADLQSLANKPPVATVSNGTAAGLFSSQPSPLLQSWLTREQFLSEMMEPLEKQNRIFTQLQQEMKQMQLKAQQYQTQHQSTSTVPTQSSSSSSSLAHHPSTTLLLTNLGSVGSVILPQLEADLIAEAKQFGPIEKLLLHEGKDEIVGYLTYSELPSCERAFQYFSHQPFQRRMVQVNYFRRTTKLTVKHTTSHPATESNKTIPNNPDTTFSYDQPHHPSDNTSEFHTKTILTDHAEGVPV